MGLCSADIKSPFPSDHLGNPTGFWSSVCPKRARTSDTFIINQPRKMDSYQQRAQVGSESNRIRNHLH